MQSNELITIQKYAATHRLSIHNVIKKTMNGELPTLTREENGKEVTYIVLSPSETKEIPQTVLNESVSDDEIQIDYKKEYEALHKEHLILKAKYDKLLQAQSKS